MLRRLGIYLSLTSLIVLLSPVVAGPASAACTESSKFTYRSGDSYGVMGTLYVYDQYNDPSCTGSRAQTTFLRLSINYLDYVEVGAYTYSDNKFGVFFEYRDYPQTAAYFPPTTFYSTNRYMSFNVSPTTAGGYTWKTQYSFGQTQANWATRGSTTPMIANRGLAESEISVFDNSAARHYAYGLKYRPAGGGWLAWNSLGCDLNQQSITNWDAIKLSNSSWQTVPGYPAPGDC